MKHPKYYQRFYRSIGQPGAQCHVTREMGPEGETVLVHTIYEDYHFSSLTEREQRIALMWIRANLLPGNVPPLGTSSYGLKHMLEHRTGVYMTNNQFKEAMLQCGFYPEKVNEQNWYYSIRKKSPALK